MHESGLVRSLVHEVERAIQASYEGNGAHRVLSVRVRMGALCSFSESHLREHFAREAKGTVAEHASLVIESDGDPTDLAYPVVLDANAQDVTLLSIEVEQAPQATAWAADRIMERETYPFSRL
jgi:hydrogenase nickel incorporation protein HypA/HybF